jgi:hypothetical protein
VTLKLAVSNNGNLNYASKTEFKSDKNGTIDLSKSVPECGSYKNPDLMSIFWTMKPQENSDARFWPLKIDESLECKYQVYDQENLLAEEMIYKDYMADGVKRIVVKSGQIRGTLFLPPGKINVDIFRKFESFCVFKLMSDNFMTI